jgi:predicted lipoprotein
MEARVRALLRPRWIGLAAVVALVAAILLSTEYRSADEPASAQQKKFDPAAYGAETYQNKVVPAIEQGATPLPELIAALTADKEAAGQKYGHRQGTGPYSFAVKGEGTAGKVTGNLLAVTGTGLPGQTRISIQVGPAINGTALRDAAGFITFGQFLNQVEYADAATALNNEMRTTLLSTLDPSTMDGKKITFTGAFSFITPAVITITPIAIEVVP